MLKFSDKLELLLSDNKSQTLGELTESFSSKSFAILFLLLLALPALPLPTGGVTHVFEIIALLLAIELIAGRKTVWLPKKWLNKPLPAVVQSSVLPRFIKLIRWVEKYSKPRLSNLMTNRALNSIIGIVYFLFTLFAFLAPPFTGLDTLPALSVVLLSLAIIFEDFSLLVISIVVGGAGIILVLTLGNIVLRLI